jgi:hypothetical protein
MVDIAVSEDGVFSGDVRKAVSTSMRLSDFLHDKRPGAIMDADQDRQGATLKLYLAQCQIHSEGSADVPQLPKLSKFCACLCVMRPRTIARVHALSM